MKYIVDGFKFCKESAAEEEARKCFEEVKRNFNHCELKAVKMTPVGYYAESIEIFRK